MIAKKNSRVDLERKRIVLFQIGLLTAGSFTLAAFNYSTPMKTELEKQAVAHQPVFYNLDKPEPEKIIEPIVKPPVQNNDDASSSITFENDQLSENVSERNNTFDIPDFRVNLPDVGTFKITNEDVAVNGEDIELFPATSAEYIGGAVQMQTDIFNKLVYPEIDISMGNQGIVYVSFVVEKDGSISNVAIERGISETIDREAKRIVKGFPNWKPAENAYGKVRTIVRLPLKFIIK